MIGDPASGLSHPPPGLRWRSDGGVRDGIDRAVPTNRYLVPECRATAVGPTSVAIDLTGTGRSFLLTPTEARILAGCDSPSTIV
jgi:hypothetical protein